MGGINPDDLEHLSVDDLHRRLKAESVHSSLAVRIRAMIERKTHAAQDSHREIERSAWGSLQKRVEAIENKIPKPKSEWRTWSLWVAVIALGWQIGEKIPWRSLLPGQSPAASQKANESTPSLPAQPPQSGQRSPSESKSGAPASTSPQEAAKESPLTKTLFEHPQE